MTNIVGGNAGNLSQPNTPQEGPSGKSISTGAGLDFLSLISTVNAAQKGSNTHTVIRWYIKKVLTLIRFQFRH